MENRRFDAVTRAFAADSNRRRLLKGLLGLGATGLGVVVAQDETDAARRPTPTPKPISCPGRQHPVDGICTCPADAPFVCGPDCCTGQAGDPPSPTHSECCDNACCFGTCYGEEHCCPYPQVFCETAGECCDIGQSCVPGGSCCTPLTCAQAIFPFTCPAEVEDGCGNVIDCSDACPAGWACDITGEYPGLCINQTTDCSNGQSTCFRPPVLGTCDNLRGTCHATPDGGHVCISHGVGADCGYCSSNADCPSGEVCVSDLFCEFCPPGSGNGCAVPL
jgi:hypothetical protein